MKILAIEFSSPQRSVAAITESGGTEIVETGGRNTHGLAMIEQALRGAGLEREEIECLAIGIGPGSYTGIRTAIAIAQGWQIATGAKIIGISSAECVAAQALADGITGRATVVIDAQRGEFYLAEYELSGSGVAEIKPLRIVSGTHLQEREGAGNTLIGPEVTRWFESGKVLAPTAMTLGRLAKSRQDFISGEKLEPIYLRQTTFVKAPPPRQL